jgi:hypothetical protein
MRSQVVTVALAGFLLAHSFTPCSLAAESSWPAKTDKLIESVKGLLIAGETVIDVQQADLDRDGLDDLLLVTERKIPAKPPDDWIQTTRSLLVLTRQAEGGYVLRARNDKVVYCAECGGMMGDPFDGVSAAPGTYTVAHYGGSAWRWSVSTTFNYSRRDKAWQLVSVKSDYFHVADEDTTGKSATLVPPNHYGKIDLRDFDPEDFIGRGLSCGLHEKQVSGRWQRVQGDSFRELALGVTTDKRVASTRDTDVR